ncbi:hypothetical protein [Labilithrix luteola]|uniref:hypothetical protein n=1 Tax=Labilithrix luteola TaxID=1391654 RepID=UPI0011BA64E8|nr:hypothetical protein [Labilithrix luteola]
MKGDRLFTLRYALWDGTRLTIHAIHTGRYDDRGTSRITIEAVHTSGRSSDAKFRRVVWHEGQTWCHPSPVDTDDGDRTRELVTSLVAIKPGDTDSEYFDGYTPEQLDFATTYGEELTMQSWERYGEP